MNETFDAAFNSILKGPGNLVEREKIAEAQVREFGQREWTTEAPTRDVLDRQIVFQDPHGFRYTVAHVRIDGSHVRTYFDATQPIQVLDIEARAPTWEAADVLIMEALVPYKAWEQRPVSGRGVAGMFLVRYRVARPSLD